MRFHRGLRTTSQSFASLFIVMTGIANLAAAAERPNILWISAEDISPDLGCYGDTYARTPNIDRFAAESIRYTRAFTHAGVCAPSRSGLITGMYPNSIGTQNMRCKGVPPAGVKCFTEALRGAGYYCTNNVKTDYQFDPPITAWDEISNKADWRGREKHQPFFCVINLTTTHESQIRTGAGATKQRLAELSREEIHDPAQAVLPPYYPDTPKVRQDWANYADNLTAFDKQMAEILAKLEKDGLREETIVWVWGDHGRGLPRGKRWLYDSGVQVPLLIRVPEKWRAHASPKNPDSARPGSVNDQLVAFIDFAPTMLSLAGVSRDAYPSAAMFQGTPFLGPDAATAKPREYVFGHRDRMDETYDLIRYCRDQRFKYIRNFMPHVSRAQRIAYGELMPTLQEWRRLHEAGTLNAAQKIFFEPTKPVEELYDTQADPHELKNLASDPQHAETLKRMRAALRTWQEDIRDIGLIPEPIFDEYQRPNGKLATTGTPQLELSSQVGQTWKLTLKPSTIGSSIAYRISRNKPEPTDEKEPRGGWKLYAEPLSCTSDEMIFAKATRIGYKESKTIVIRPGDARPVDHQREDVSAGWWERGTLGAELQSLRSLKDRDGQGAAAESAYQAALKSEFASVRWWGLVQLGTLHSQEFPKNLAVQIDGLMTNDDSPCVRVMAARFLAARKQSDRALPLLVETFQNGQPESLKVHSAYGLWEAGEQARPHVGLLKEGVKGSEYVGRVSQHALDALGAKSVTTK